MKERSYGETHRKIMLSTEIKTHEAKAKFNRLYIDYYPP